MDVADQPRPQVVQRTFAAFAEAHRRLPEGEPRHDHGDGADQGHLDDQIELHVAGLLVDALVDRLLDQDGHDDAPRGTDRREEPRDPEPLAQDRRGLESAADDAGRRVLARRSDRAGTGDEARVDRAHDSTSPSGPAEPKGTASMNSERSDSNASTSSR